MYSLNSSSNQPVLSLTSFYLRCGWTKRKKERIGKKKQIFQHFYTHIEEQLCDQGYRGIASFQGNERLLVCLCAVCFGVCLSSLYV